MLSVAFFKAAAAAAGVKPHGTHGIRHVAYKMQREVHMWLNIAVTLPHFPCGDNVNKITCVSVGDEQTQIFLLAANFHSVSSAAEKF